jgi:hypothetical protein
LKIFKKKRGREARNEVDGKKGKECVQNLICFLRDIDSGVDHH